MNNLMTYKPIQINDGLDLVKKIERRLYEKVSFSN